ncbi:hypothetical protein [Streptomyces sp. NPDC001274]
MHGVGEADPQFVAVGLGTPEGPLGAADGQSPSLTTSMRPPEWSAWSASNPIIMPYSEVKGALGERTAETSRWEKTDQKPDGEFPGSLQIFASDRMYSSHMPKRASVV